MPIVIDCPSCERKLRVPDDLMGQKVKCPTCGTTFDAAPRSAATPEPVLAPSSASAPLTPAPVLQDSAAPASTPATEHNEDVTTQDTAPRPAASGGKQACPFCGETISKNATRCKYCEEDLTTDDGDDNEDDRPWERGHPAMVRRDCDPHRGGLVLGLGIIGLILSCFFFCYGLPALAGVPISIAAMVMGRSDLKRMKLGEVDPMGQGQTQGGWICGIIGTIIGIVGLLLVGAFFVFMVTMMTAAAKTMPPPRAMPAPAPAPVTKPMQQVNPPKMQQKDMPGPAGPDKGPPGKVAPPPINKPGNAAPKDKAQEN